MRFDGGPKLFQNKILKKDVYEYKMTFKRE
jgi:hypothetical protein